MEATTTASAVTYGLLKFILGHTIAAAVASAVGFFVITPRTVREAMVRIVSTLFASFIVGPIVVAYFHVHYPLLFEAAAKQASAEGLTGVGEMYVSWPIVVLCGLPAWWVVGWVLRWFDNRRDKDLGQVVAEASVIMTVLRRGASETAASSLTEAAAETMRAAVLANPTHAETMVSISQISKEAVSEPKDT